MHFVDRVAVFFEHFSLLIGEGVGEFIAIIAHQGEQVFEMTVATVAFTLRIYADYQKCRYLPTSDRI
ncbi:MAG: hypothetical protein IJT66_02795 [Clostridia bacterium]|nr:hypothetical protein [Clostridia bacterium]